MKKSLIILIVLTLIISIGYLSELIFGQPVTPSGRIHFINLFDVPSTYDSQAGKGVRVNTAMDALEFFTLSLGDFDNQTAWRIFYSNTDGDITELALGTNGQYLKSNGASSVPSWSTIAGGGDLLADGTVPLTANWDVGNFDITLKSLTGDGTIEGVTLTEGGQAVWNATETDILDSGHYIAGSIDAEHLAGDIIDETKIADDGLDSEHYNNGSIDLVHLAAGVYAKDLVTTAPITGAADNIFVGADSDVTVALTLLKDIVTTAPITGGENDVLPGADADLTIAITLAKDLVTTAPVTGGTDNIFPGADADITVALDFTAAWDFGGAASLEIPNGTDPDVAVTGQLHLDTDGGNEPNSVTLRTAMGTDEQAIFADTLKHYCFSVAEPDNLAQADFHPVWKNRTGFSFIITAIHGESDIDDFDFTLKERDADGANVTTIEAVQLSTDGTAMYYGSVVFADIDHTTIEAGHTIGFDKSADDATYVLVVFSGYYNADVN